MGLYPIQNKGKAFLYMGDTKSNNMNKVGQDSDSINRKLTQSVFCNALFIGSNIRDLNPASATISKKKRNPKGLRFFFFV